MSSFLQDPSGPDSISNSGSSLVSVLPTWIWYPVTSSPVMSSFPRFLTVILSSRSQVVSMSNMPSPSISSTSGSSYLLGLCSFLPSIWYPPHTPTMGFFPTESRMAWAMPDSFIHFMSIMEFLVPGITMRSQPSSCSLSLTNVTFTFSQ